ncbi:CRISPR-associated protein Cas2 [Clostridium sp. WILCCON 0269]|uniref:CRISPR-associated protein Cas2 n=1 Tax=Candidatus Clostridium eludens TaxID=3381663 RepID=A0ABW8SNR4_9CLOT
MTSKIITYDLCAPGQDYTDLIAEIKKYSRWSKITESSWLIDTDDSCVSIRDNLNKYLDSNDRIFVGELTGEAAWRNIICGSDGLKERLIWIKK